MVKWKYQPSEYATWMLELEIYKYNVNLEDPMNNYFLPSKYDVGASRQSPMFVEEAVNVIFLLPCNQFYKDRVSCRLLKKKLWIGFI